MVFEFENFFSTSRFTYFESNFSGNSSGEIGLGTYLLFPKPTFGQISNSNLLLILPTFGSDGSLKSYLKLFSFVIIAVRISADVDTGSAMYFGRSKKRDGKLLN